MNTHWKALAAWCFAAAFMLPLQGMGEPDPYKILREIPGYYSLFERNAIKSYEAQVEAKGKMWDEMVSAMASRNIDGFKLKEYYVRPDKLALRIETRDLLYTNLISAVFDPHHLFRILMDELESFREPATFKRIKKAAVSTIESDQTHFRIRLKPAKGKYIVRKYHDTGTESAIVQLITLSATVKKQPNLIEMLQLERSVSSRSVNNKPKDFELTTVRCDFNYQKHNGNYYPSELIVRQGDKIAIMLKTEYGNNDGTILPRRKEFIYRMGGKMESISFFYKQYSLNEEVDKTVFHGNASSTSPKLQRANRLSIAAQNAFMKGRISEARKRLMSLTKTCAESPQAFQAEAFLEGLPHH